MIDGMPVIDAVVHAYDTGRDNFANRFAEPLVQLVYGATYAASVPGYRLPYDAWARDWGMDEVANMTFLESDTDLAVHHVLPIYAFKDGLCSVEKTLEAKTRWPDRFIVYCGVDPLQGEAAIEEMERQVEALEPVGLKLYPNSWTGEQINGWLMDDPEVAFPLFDRAQQLGIKVVAIHKAVPLGPVPIEHYKVDDIDRAAMAFPDLNFEIVHGGAAFVEETAWQIARFENVYVNLEITASMILTGAPRQFHDLMWMFLRTGGPHALERIMWGTGAMAVHPRPSLERFARDFHFDDAIVEGGGVAQLTEADKRKILAENYARMIGLDLDARLAAVRDDEFARQRNGGPAEPFSTTTVAGRAE